MDDRRKGITGEYDGYHYHKEENLTPEERKELKRRADKLLMQLREESRRIRENMGKNK